jgi:hypothetical protein
MGFFSKLFAKDRVKISERKAKDLASHGRHTEAAQVFSTAAVEEMSANELISVDYYHDAFTEYVKAQDPKSAVEQARKALAVMSADDGSWIKYDSGGETEDLTAMARELFDAGYKREARVVAKEVNDQFTKYGLSIRVVLPEAAVRLEFPALCPQCGAPVSPDETADEMQCPFCSCVIYAEPVSQ